MVLRDICRYQQTNKYKWRIVRMGMIRVDKVQVTYKTHIDDLRSLDMVSIDMWNGVEMEVKPNSIHYC
ncbi:MAG: hypothetical protein HOB81_02805 [Flavobacteriaceae bacterium]|nr:hypothetical protein [Flavobacteriaceae bacterium]